jgi:signal transduction histidine kinase
MENEKAAAVSSYEMTLQTVQLVNLVDIRQDLSSIRTALDRMEAVSDQAGIQLTRNGEAIYRSGQPIDRLPNVSESRLLLFAEDGRHFLQISGPVRTNDAPLQLDILYEITPIYTARAEQLATYHRVFLGMLILGGAAAGGIAWFLTRPLGKLSGAARRLAAGKLDARAQLQARDEVGQLGAEFDRMAEQLSETITAQQEEMERQEQFMGSFAHELKTPMTSIIGYADLLRGQSLDEQEAQEAANYIFSEGKRLEALSIKLLDLLMVKHQPPTLKATRMATVIESLASHLQPVYQQSGITLQCRCQDGLCCLDPDLFRSVLVNLLDNARKALPDGGNIYVLGDQTQDGYRVRVLDNGRGMPEEAIRHLTEAFYRVDKARSRAQGGAGLGLTLCSRIIELHKGTISFASREGNGTCVTIILPEVPA